MYCFIEFSLKYCDMLFQEEVMVLERILLQTIKFDLQVDHPYQFLLKYAKCLKGMFWFIIVVVTLVDWYY